MRGGDGLRGIPWASSFGYDWGMKRMLSLGVLFAIGLFAIGLFASAASAQEPVQPLCYWCMRDAIYADISLIDHLEANPDIDDAVKGPEIAVVRPNIQRLRVLLGPVVDTGAQPCCYSRRRLVIR